MERYLRAHGLADGIVLLGLSDHVLVRQHTLQRVSVSLFPSILVAIMLMLMLLRLEGISIS